MEILALNQFFRYKFALLLGPPPQTCHAEWTVLCPFMPSCSVGDWLSLSLTLCLGSREVALWTMGVDSIRAKCHLNSGGLCQPPLKRRLRTLTEGPGIMSAIVTGPYLQTAGRWSLSETVWYSNGHNGITTVADTGECHLICWLINKVNIG